MPLKDEEQRRVYNQTYWEEHRIKKQAYMKVYRQEHKAEIAAKRLALKMQVLAHYSGNGVSHCIKCGIADIDVLCVDHINGGGNEHVKSIGGQPYLYRWLKKNNYPEGYQTLCANCNMKKEVLRRRDNVN